MIRGAERKLDPPLDRVPDLCECDDIRCCESIRLTTSEYERARTDPRRYIIVSGPGLPDFESVIDSRDE